MSLDESGNIISTATVLLPPPKQLNHVILNRGLTHKDSLPLINFFFCFRIERKVDIELLFFVTVRVGADRLKKVVFCMYDRKTIIKKLKKNTSTAMQY